MSAAIKQLTRAAKRGIISIPEYKRSLADLGAEDHAVYWRRSGINAGTAVSACCEAREFELEEWNNWVVIAEALGFTVLEES